MTNAIRHDQLCNLDQLSKGNGNCECAKRQAQTNAFPGDREAREPETPATTIHGVIEKGRYSKKPVTVWCGVPVKPVSEKWQAGDTAYAPFWTNAVNCQDCITAATKAANEGKTK